MTGWRDGFLFHVMLKCLTKKAEPPPTRDVNRDSGTGPRQRRLASGRLVRPHGVILKIVWPKNVCQSAPRQPFFRFRETITAAAAMIISRTKKPELEPDKAASNIFIKSVRMCLTKKAEPPPTRDVNRDSGTASANGGWLRRLVRRRHHYQIMLLTRRMVEYTICCIRIV